MAQVGSTWEQNVIDALTELKIEFEIQVPFFGGWMPGGTIVDVVIYKEGAIRPIALFVDGPHWHPKKDEPYQTQKRMRLEKKGYTIMVMTDEAETKEQAKKWLKENL